MMDFSPVPGVEKACKKIGCFILPAWLKDPLKYFAGSIFYYRLTGLCRRNTVFKNIHQGQRCFILCNGPSINRQNLLPLKDEIVFSVGSGYLYKDYAAIHPKYYCLPGIVFSELLTEDVAVEWYRQVDSRVNSAALFLNAFDKALIEKNNLFSGRTLNFVCAWSFFSENIDDIIDISKVIPDFQSVSIMALMIAMYMGFKKIYLIGTEHDFTVTGEYKHFYPEDCLRRKDRAVDSEGRIKDLKSEQRCFQNLIKQYRVLDKIASEHGVSVYNATAGGILEVFPRVNLEDVLSNVSGQG